MSRMQEGSDPVQCSYAQLANSIRPQTNKHERSPRVPEPGCYEGSDVGPVRKDPVVRIVHEPTSRDVRNGSDTNKKLESPTLPQTQTPDRQKHSHAGSQSICHKVSGCLPRDKDENQPFATQIRIFQEREDLRECLIPGMVSGISQKACEGWRHQSTARSSRFLAKIKLGPCRDCKYFREPCGSLPRRALDGRLDNNSGRQPTEKDGQEPGGVHQSL